MRSGWRFSAHPFTQPVPQQLGEQAEPQKQATRAAVEARAQVRLARKYDGLKKRNKSLYPDQLALAAKLHDGRLEAEANRLTMKSGHGRHEEQRSCLSAECKEQLVGRCKRGQRNEDHRGRF